MIWCPANPALWLRNKPKNLSVQCRQWPILGGRCLRWAATRSMGRRCELCAPVLRSSLPALRSHWLSFTEHLPCAGQFCQQFHNCANRETIGQGNGADAVRRDALQPARGFPGWTESSEKCDDTREDEPRPAGDAPGGERGGRGDPVHPRAQPSAKTCCLAILQKPRAEELPLPPEHPKPVDQLWFCCNRCRLFRLVHRWRCRVGSKHEEAG